MLIARSPRWCASSHALTTLAASEEASPTMKLSLLVSRTFELGAEKRGPTRMVGGSARGPLLLIMSAAPLMFLAMRPSAAFSPPLALRRSRVVPWQCGVSGLHGLVGGNSVRIHARPAERRSFVAGREGAGDGVGQPPITTKQALRVLWKIRGAALADDRSAPAMNMAISDAQSAEEQSGDVDARASFGMEPDLDSSSLGEGQEPTSLLPSGAYDDLPSLPNAIGQQQSRDYAAGEEEYVFDGVKRAGTVTIIGAPNAGKSTLLNYLVGSKIAIVTHKRQTTRTSITGIAMEGGTQVVYIDTPGIMDARPGQRLNKAMVKSAWNSARDADEIFFIVDADKIIPGGMGPGRTGRKLEPVVHPVPAERLRFKANSNEDLIMKRLLQRNQRYNLILNKVDQLRDDRKSLLLPLAEELRRCAGSDTSGAPMVKKVFAVSASAGKGLTAIRDFLRDSLPQGDWLYPIDQISNVPVRSIMAEFTREAIFLRAHEEVPLLRMAG